MPRVVIPGQIRLDSRATTRAEVLSELAEILGGEDATVREAVGDALRERERVSTTGIGGGLAIPHARVDALPAIRVALVRTIRPVEFGALDSHGVDLFFGVAGPSHLRREHLSTLATISYALRSGALRQALREASSPAEVESLLERVEERPSP